MATYPPRSEQLLRSQPLGTLFTSRQLSYEILDVLAVEPELLRLHPDAVLALVQGWQAVRVEESRRPSAVLQAMANYLGLHLAMGLPHGMASATPVPRSSTSCWTCVRTTCPRYWRKSFRCSMAAA